MYLYHSIQRNAKIFGKQIATVCSGRQYTWAETEQRIARLAGALAAHGVKAGEHLAILSTNSARYFEYFYAAPWVGAILVPLNIRWSVKENVYSIEDSNSTVLFVDDAFMEMGRQLTAETDRIRLTIYMGDKETPEGMLGFEQLIEKGEAIAPVASGYDSLAGIFYTGGTTGFPKGVMLSHQNMWTCAISVMANIGLNCENDRYLHAAPMFHLADAAFSQSAAIGGLTHVFIPFFEAESVIRTIETERVTHTLLVPTMISMLLASPSLSTADLSSLKTIVYGASPMPEGTLIEAMKKMPTVGFVQAYGQSELGPLCSILGAEWHVLEGPKAGKLRSAGLPGYCVNVEIRDADGQELPRGKVGEVVVCGPNSMMGYWNKPEQTASTLIDGWVMTGDVGYMDEDGFIFLVDRSKDMIISGGENVFSVEVESALSTHPAVMESVVIGIPDEQWGEAVHAIVRLKNGESATRESIISHCRTLIAGYKVPRSLEFREDPFPTTGAGKLRKVELRQPFWAGVDRGIN
ncbi:long-chain-fatty-acid--CoA ligase [Alcanivorax sp. 1008]|uniref:long-chain-fatty-acid--CoA ligase n=1 Tax=Alcanivorax sp. 1008 TaxID=2816853 RepID=UPI001D4E1186|nr:long-chain-fatty-acid--CoA ligase [Alcanivorax sp. 1008]MCC1495944.1 long-chain-fatty-acid--CoA ligase [Alcanivorax sp. 1008]